MSKRNWKLLFEDIVESITRIEKYTEKINHEWISLKKIKALNNEVSSKPLQFANGFSATKVRERNRNR